MARDASCQADSFPTLDRVRIVAPFAAPVLPVWTASLLLPPVIQGGFDFGGRFTLIRIADMRELRCCAP